MVPNTPEAWRKAIIEHRIEEIRSSMGRRDWGLDQVVNELENLPNVQDWMLPGLLDAAVRAWEDRNRALLDDYDHSLAQSSWHMHPRAGFDDVDKPDEQEE